MHRIDAQLVEMNFGAWEGGQWSAIPRAEIDAWAQDFEHYAAGGGESVRMLVERVAAWNPSGIALVVTHAGWMRARRWNEMARTASGVAQTSVVTLPLSAQTFPASPTYGELWQLS